MSLENNENEDNSIEIHKNSLYFDKRHKKEEIPFQITAENQNYCEILEEYFEMICPQTSTDESMV